MNTVGILGLLLAIATLIYLSSKGLNIFITSLAASVIIIITNTMPFWESMTVHYATAMKNFIGTYFLLFGLASAYGAFMKASGAAETVAGVIFRVFGEKWVPVACVFATLLLSFGGVNAFVVVFAIYPIADPLFKKANVSKDLMPGIFLCASVVLCLALPGAPSSMNAMLAMTGLATTAYAAPIMGIVACIFGLIFSSVYVTIVSRRGVASGHGYTSSCDEAGGELSGDSKKLPTFLVSILPLLAVVVVMFFLKERMTALNAVMTSLIVAIILAIILNFKILKGSIVKNFTDGFWSSTGVLLLTSSVMGFAGVAQNAPQFQHFINFAMSLSDVFNPYVSGAVAINILAGVSGTALGSLQIFINTMLDGYLELGINPEAFHRMLLIASCGLDTLPNSGTLITMCAVCGVTLKGCYKHVFVLTVILPLLMTVLCILMALVGIV